VQQARHFIVRLLRAGQRGAPPLNCGVMRQVEATECGKTGGSFSPGDHEAPLRPTIQGLKARDIR
jgi:hypothetical protein